MRLQSVLRPWSLAAIWTVICLILMIVGFATLVSQPNGNGDLLAAVASPALSDGDVAAMGLALWLLGILFLLLAAGIRRVSRAIRRAAD